MSTAANNVDLGGSENRRTTDSSGGKERELPQLIGFGGSDVEPTHDLCDYKDTNRLFQLAVKLRVLD